MRKLLTLLVLFVALFGSATARDVQFALPETPHLSTAERTGYLAQTALPAEMALEHEANPAFAAPQLHSVPAPENGAHPTSPTGAQHLRAARRDEPLLPAAAGTGKKKTVRRSVFRRPADHYVFRMRRLLI